MTDDADQGAAAGLRIGAVSRITDVPVDTLRAWERRYDIVTPRRSGGSARLYSPDDVERLKLIKRLIGHGHAIGSLAGLTLTALQAKLALHDDSAARDAAAEVSSVLFYGDALENEAESAASQGLHVLGVERSWSAFEAEVFNTMPGAVVMEADALTPAVSQSIQRLVSRVNPIRAIVVYGFGADAELQALQSGGITTLQAPLGTGLLVRELGRPLAQRAADTPSLDEAPTRLFSHGELAALSKITSAVQCECPHHLVDIIRTLLRFETYSAECENRDDEDAALHRLLKRTTGNARAMFEQALIRVAEYEDVPLPDHIPRTPQPGD